MKTIKGMAAGVLTCAVAGISTLGCNTIGGAGRDIQRGGQAVEDAADSAHNESVYHRNEAERAQNERDHQYRADRARHERAYRARADRARNERAHQRDAAEQARDDRMHQAARPHMIVASSDLGGSISPAGSTRVHDGANQTFVISPNIGYHVADVLVDGRSMGAVSRHTFDNVAKSHTIAVVFNKNWDR